VTDKTSEGGAGQTVQPQRDQGSTTQGRLTIQQGSSDDGRARQMGGQSSTPTQFNDWASI
jgi:hypothetical protein